jgi:uncharacterized protein YprB with RNaseH-like and TPR domain
MKVAFWDLETTGLNANMGNVLACGVLDYATDKVDVYRLDEKPFRPKRKHRAGRTLDKGDDRKLVVAVRNRLEEAHMNVAHNLHMFDKPYLNARLLYWDERPLAKRMCLDTKPYCGGVSLRIGGTSLKTAQQFFGTGAEKSDLDWEIWRAARELDRDAMDYIVDHCVRDLKVLKEVYDKILPIVRQIQYR